MGKFTLVIAILLTLLSFFTTSVFAQYCVPCAGAGGVCEGEEFTDDCGDVCYGEADCGAATNCEWSFDHNECTGCREAQSVERNTCDGSTQVSDTGVFDDGCNDVSLCGPAACNPDCSAASSTCQGTQFSDSCQGQCYGTLDCTPPQVCGWEFDHNECTGCGVARSVDRETCTGQTKVSNTGIQDPGCINNDWCGQVDYQLCTDWQIGTCPNGGKIYMMCKPSCNSANQQCEASGTCTITNDCGTPGTSCPLAGGAAPCPGGGYTDEGTCSVEGPSINCVADCTKKRCDSTDPATVPCNQQVYNTCGDPQGTQKGTKNCAIYNSACTGPCPPGTIGSGCSGFQPVDPVAQTMGQCSCTTASITANCTPIVCPNPSLYTCGAYVKDNAGSICTRGTKCPLGQICDTATWTCIARITPTPTIPICTPDCSSAPNFCITQAFPDGCGSLCVGTKNCSGGVCTPRCSNAPNVCSGQTFSDGCGGSCIGTEDCTPPTITYAGPIKSCFSPSTWERSQPVKVLVTDDQSGIRSVTFKLTNTNNNRFREFTALKSGSYWTYTFSRDSFNLLGGVDNPFRLEFKATDNTGNSSNYSDTLPYTINYSSTCNCPFVSTQGGDVHSNTPGGASCS